MRYRLGTLLIVLALGPPVLASVWWAFNAPPIVARDLLETAVFAIIALVGCVFGPLWIDNVRSRMS